MPKPTDSYTWNDNETNEAVPTGGHASDGYANGEIPASNEWNHMFRINGEVSRWVGDGSAAPDEDAHIVETDATGQANVALAVFGPPTTTPDDATLVVYGPADQGVAILAFGSDGGGAGINATGGDSQPGGFFTGGSNGGNGVYAQGLDTGHGVVGYGGEAGNGGEFHAGNNGTAGVLGDGNATGNGVDGTGGSASGYGVRGVPGNADSAGVYARSHGSGTTSGAGLFADGINNANAIYAQAANGYCLVMLPDLTSPARAAMRMIPQGADPTTLEEGGVWFNSARSDLRIRVNSQTKTVHASPGGLAFAQDTGESNTNNNSAAWTTLASVTLTGQYQPQSSGGTVVISACAEFGATGGTLHTTFDVQIYDNTAAAVVWSRTIDHPASAASVYDRPWSVQVDYTLPSTGNRTFYLQFRRIGAGGTGISARDASLVVTGIY